MIKKVLCLGLVAALAACGGNDGATTNAGPSGAAAQQVAGYRPLPGGVELGLNAHLRRDRIYKTKNGDTRRKVVYEVLDGTQQEAVAKVQGARTAAGYVAQPRKDGKREAFVIPYKKEKAATLNVEFNPRAGRKPSNPKAKHLVTVDWRVKAAAKI